MIDMPPGERTDPGCPPASVRDDHTTQAVDPVKVTCCAHAVISDVIKVPTCINPHEDTMSEPIAPWRQIYTDLRHQIETGKFRPGEQFLSTGELQEEYSHLSPVGALSPAPVRRAVQKLREEGYLTYWPGLGMYVAKEPPAGK